MTGTEKILEQMRKAPTNVRFADLQKVCEAYFGKPRQRGSSHAVYKTLAGRSAGEHSKR